MFPCLSPERSHPVEAAFDGSGALPSVSLRWGKSLGREKQTCWCRRVFRPPSTPAKVRYAPWSWAGCAARCSL